MVLVIILKIGTAGAGGTLADTGPIAHVAKFHIEVHNLCPQFIVKARDLAIFKNEACDETRSSSYRGGCGGMVV